VAGNRIINDAFKEYDSYTEASTSHLSTYGAIVTKRDIIRTVGLYGSGFTALRFGLCVVEVGFQSGTRKIKKANRHGMRSLLKQILGDSAMERF
jgi:hypothetical protein